MSTLIREPVQERAIEKKKKIIEASYELFAEVGYYNTNTAEIAKRAGVSTGIVYGYFKDKRDILLEVLEIYIDNVYEPTLAMLEQITLPLNLEYIAPHVVEEAIKTHIKYAKIHETLHSLTSADSEVKKKFMELEDNITLKIADRFSQIGFVIADPYEKIHLIMNVVQSFAHEYVYDKHSYLDYDKMKKLVCANIIGLLR